MFKRIVLPVGFEFTLVEKLTKKEISTPCALSGMPWRTWEDIPTGIAYWINNEISLPGSFEFSVGPNVRHIAWDDDLYESLTPESMWLNSGWKIEQISSLDDIRLK